MTNNTLDKINIGSGDHFVPFHNTPLPDSMLTGIYFAIKRHQAP